MRVSTKNLCRGAIACAALTLAGCAAQTDLATTAAIVTAPSPLLPAADHHKHLISAKAALGAYPAPASEVALPHEFAALLAQRQAAWNDPERLAPLYAEKAVVQNSDDEDSASWISGRTAVAGYVSRLFGREPRIKPIAFGLDGNRGFIAGYFVRSDGDRHFGHVMLSLIRAADGQWQIDAEAPTFPGPRSLAGVDAAEVIAQLDEAGVAKAAVLSVAYWASSPFQALSGAEEIAAVQAENDWAGEQVALYPRRLYGFCSVNPLKSYAAAEVRRCAAGGKLKGLKLHLGNSRVDLRDPEQAAQVAAVMAEANRNAMPIIVHLWNGPNFDREGDIDARAFIERVLPSAPDSFIQIAHMAGGGRASQPAIEVFAEHIEKDDPRTRNVYFDVATSTDGETIENLRRDAAIMRRIGVNRFLFGSDTSVRTLDGWGSLFRLPLTPAEFAVLANSTAPYFRELP